MFLKAFFHNYSKDAFLLQNDCSLLFQIIRMVYSMTGFGRAEGVVNGRQIVVEIKSLNGKQFEIGIKLPPILRSYELDIRNLLNTKLFRGSIDFNIAIRQDGASKPMVINTDLAIYYYKGMKQISDKLNLPEDNVLSTIMRMPEVVVPESDVLPEDEFKGVFKVIEEAANLLMDHRKNEGDSLEKDLSLRITNIEALLDRILPLEALRTDRIRTRLNNSLRDVVGAENIDPNRFEQELIFYMERMDFSEEKTRLKQH
jgi:uncharacterized protein (TIGR00255 family)